MTRLYQYKLETAKHNNIGTKSYLRILQYIWCKQHCVLLKWLNIIMLLAALFFGENPQAVAYSALPLC